MPLTSSQRQRPRTQRPWPEQPIGHVLLVDRSQLSPDHESSHWHLPRTHHPCPEQDEGHVLVSVSHERPENPKKHEQPAAPHSPWPLQFVGQRCGSRGAKAVVVDAAAAEYILAAPKRTLMPRRGPASGLPDGKRSPAIGIRSAYLYLGGRGRPRVRGWGPLLGEAALHRW